MFLFVLDSKVSETPQMGHHWHHCQWFLVKNGQIEVNKAPFETSLDELLICNCFVWCFEDLQRTNKKHCDCQSDEDHAALGSVVDLVDHQMRMIE